MKQVIHTWDTESDEYETPTFSPLTLDNLIGNRFLTKPTEDGQHFHACAIHCIEEHDETTDNIHTKFLIHKSDDELDEIMGYKKLLEILEEQHQCDLDNNTYWQFKQINVSQNTMQSTLSSFSRFLACCFENALAMVFCLFKTINVSID